MDSTIIGVECIDELADFAGVKAEVAEITERAMRGEIAFGPALRERGQLFVGIDVIGDYLTEINVTSPTGIREVRRFGGADIAALFWDKIEDRT